MGSDLLVLACNVLLGPVAALAIAAFHGARVARERAEIEARLLKFERLPLAWETAQEELFSLLQRIESKRASAAAKLSALQRASGEVEEQTAPPQSPDERRNALRATHLVQRRGA